MSCSILGAVVFVFAFFTTDNTLIGVITVFVFLLESTFEPCREFHVYYLLCGEINCLFYSNLSVDLLV